MAATQIPASGNQFSPFPPLVLYIDSAYLKSVTPICSNVDEHTILCAIQTSQSKFVMPTIGSSLDGFIQQEIMNGSITGDTWNLPLLNNFMQPMAAYAAASELIPHIVWQAKNKGLQIKHSEFAVSAGKEDVVFMMKTYKDTAEYWARRLKLFIEDNISNYPLYYNPGSHLDDMNPNASSYDGFGVHIPGLSRNNPIANTGPYFGLGLDIDVNF